MIRQYGIIKGGILFPRSSWDSLDRMRQYRCETDIDIGTNRQGLSDRYDNQNLPSHINYFARDSARATLLYTREDFL